MAVRMLHISDLHLDANFKTKKPHVAKHMRRAQYNSFNESINQALALRCDLFAMTGDVFHGLEMTFKTEDFLLSGIKRLLDAGLVVVYQTGNHDYSGLQRSLKTLVQHPSFICFDATTPTTYRRVINDMPVALIGCGHDEKSIQKNMASQFPRGLREETTIGFYHGMVYGSVAQDDEEPYMACSLGDLESKGYSYWALGHIHKRQKLTSQIAYAGSLQALRRSETEKKGGWLVELDSNVTELSFVPLSTLEFRDLTLDLTDSQEDMPLYHRLKRAVLEAMSSDSAQFIFNVTLMGYSEEYDKIITEDFVEDFLSDFNDERLIDLGINADLLAPSQESDMLSSHYLQIAVRALMDTQMPDGLASRLSALDMAGFDATQLLEHEREQLKCKLLQYFKEV